MATKEKDFYIHESSYIDEDVSIGEENQGKSNP